MPKTTFKVKDEKGVEYKLAILHPTEELLAEANAVQNKIFRESLNKGALLGAALDKLMRDQGLWDDTKQKSIEKLAKEVNDKRVKLKRGGIRQTEGKELAMRIVECIDEQRALLSDRAVYNSRTADGQADNARFNYLVHSCTVDSESGEQLYSDLHDYEQKASTEVAVQAASKLAEVMFGAGFAGDESTIENRFLKKFGYVDDKMRLVDEDGSLVDKEGRLIDEEGRFVDSNGDYVDINGQRVDESGEPLVEELPFLDEEDQPIEFPAENVESVDDEEESEESEESAEEVKPQQKKKTKKEPVIV